MRHWVDSCLDAILPRSCVCCNFECGRGNLCLICRRNLPWLGHACKLCSLPLPVKEDSHCGACQQKRPPFCAAHAPLIFDFPVNRLVHGFKFRRNLAMGDALANLACGYMAQQASLDAQLLPGLWVPVPMHRRRLCVRMFNPAFYLAKRLAEHSNVKLAHHQLQRRRNTRTQTGLGAVERKKNLKGAFHWRGSSISGLHIGLVDDVMTTGSTVSECSRVLLGSGASQVSVWVLARAVSS